MRAQGAFALRLDAKGGHVATRGAAEGEREAWKIQSRAKMLLKQQVTYENEYSQIAPPSLWCVLCVNDYFR